MSGDTSQGTEGPGYKLTGTDMFVLVFGTIVMVLGIILMLAHLTVVGVAMLGIAVLLDTIYWPYVFLVRKPRSGG